MTRRVISACILSTVGASLGLGPPPGAVPRDAAPTQEAASGPDRFAPLDWLIGEWRGFGLFADDTTYIHKRFAYEVAGRFLVERTLDIFPPERPTTDFELHQDLTVYYRVGEAFRAKGFFVEGFVWNSDVEVRNGGETLVVRTSEVEAAPPGTRARVTLRRTDEDRLEATFEIAWPDAEFETFERLTMRRVSQ